MKRFIVGLCWAAVVPLAGAAPVRFVDEVKPILEFNCLSCHQNAHAKGGLRLDMKEFAFHGGEQESDRPGEERREQVVHLHDFGRGRR